MPTVLIWRNNDRTSYRGSVGEDLQREKKNEVEIQAALDQSKRAMRFGDTFGAVSALEAVKQVIQRLLRGYIASVVTARISTQQQ